MKERFCTVLLWWAFVHGLITILAIATDGFSGRELYEVRKYISKPYFEIFLKSDGLVLAFAPVAWAAVYVMTGNLRILPWERPEQANDE